MRGDGHNADVFASHYGGADAHSVLGPASTALTAGTHAAQVMGSGSYPEYTVVVPPGWFDQAGRFIITGPTEPVLAFSVWDVGLVSATRATGRARASTRGRASETSLPRSSPRRCATPPRRPM